MKRLWKRDSVLVGHVLVGRWHLSKPLLDTRHMLLPSQFVQGIIVNLVRVLLWVVSGALMTISLWFPPVESDSVIHRTERDTKHSLPVHIIVDLNLPVGSDTAATASDDDSSMITIELAEGDCNV